LTDGFPPNAFVAVAAGGAPPWGQDFNGILRQITQWNQWQQAGAPIVYDAAFQTSIGGYPMGAVVQIGAGGPAFMSTVDNNAAVPASGAAGWMPLPTFGGNVTTVSGTGALTAQSAGLVLVNASSGNINITMPAVSGVNGLPLPFCFVRTDNSANSVTLIAASGDTFWPIQASSFSVSPLTSYQVKGDGSHAWWSVGGTNFAAINGSAIQAFNVAPASTVNQAVNLGQFASSLASSGYQKLPSGLIVQWGNVLTSAANTPYTWTFPIAFPNASLSVSVQSNDSSGPYATGIYTGVGPSYKASVQFTTADPGSSKNHICMAIGY
jgi:hypothetical protein